MILQQNEQESCIKNHELWIKNADLCNKHDEFCIKNVEFCIKNVEFCIKNDELSIRNDGFCIKNDEFTHRRAPRAILPLTSAAPVFKIMSFVLKTMKFASQMMDFVLK